jgi:hypothetical protein
MSQRLILLLALIATGPHAARAQSPDDADSSTAGRYPVAVWGSLGIGTGKLRGANGGSAVGVIRGNVSVGPLLLTYRGSDVGLFLFPGSGDGVREDGALVGLRTDGRRIFASAALGFAGASTYHVCDGCGAQRVDPRVGVLAYDVMIHANYLVPGIHASLSGSVGPARVTHYATTIGLELGWFGQ